MPQSIGEELTSLFDDEAADVCSADDLQARLRTSHRSWNPLRARTGPLLSAAAVVVLAGALVAILDRGPTGRSVSRTEPAGSRSAGAVLTPDDRRHIAKDAVTVLVHLDTTTIPAGARLHATALVVNTTGHAIAIPEGCQGWPTVTLANHAVHPIYGSLASHCAKPEWLRPGLTTRSITIPTTYGGCVTPGQGRGRPNEGTPDAGMPVCRPATVGSAPPLPTGSYHTVTGAFVLDVRVVGPSVHVTLTR
jgi:hypothetical protein